MSNTLKKLGYQMINKKIVLGKYKKEGNLLILQGEGQDLTDNAISCVFLWFQENLREQQEKNKNIISHDLTYDGQDEVLVMLKKKEWKEMQKAYNDKLKKEKKIIKTKTCKWEHIVDSYNDYYETKCGNDFCLCNDETLEENKIKYCPYCGGMIKEIK